jgi:hypothetical protein
MSGEFEMLFKEVSISFLERPFKHLPGGTGVRQEEPEGQD